MDGRKCNSDQRHNNDKCQCECKKIHVCEKDYVWDPAACNCENGKYLAIIKDNSVITCDELLESYGEEIKTIPTNLNEQNITVKAQNFYILLVFLLITIALLITVGKTKTFFTISRHKIKKKKSYIDN